MNRFLQPVLRRPVVTTATEVAQVAAPGRESARQAHRPAPRTSKELHKAFPSADEQSPTYSGGRGRGPRAEINRTCRQVEGSTTMPIPARPRRTTSRSVTGSVVSVVPTTGRGVLGPGARSAGHRSGGGRGWGGSSGGGRSLEQSGRFADTGLLRRLQLAVVDRLLMGGVTEPEGGGGFESFTAVGTMEMRHRVS